MIAPPPTEGYGTAFPRHWLLAESAFRLHAHLEVTKRDIKIDVKLFEKT